MVLSIFIWIFEGLVFVLGAFYLNFDHPFIFGFTCHCFVNLGLALPSTPGNIGVFEAGVILATIVFGQDKSLGLVVAVVIHIIQVLWIIFVNVIWFMYTRKSLPFVFRDFNNLYRSITKEKDD